MVKSNGFSCHGAPSSNGPFRFIAKVRLLKPEPIAADRQSEPRGFRNGSLKKGISPPPRRPVPTSNSAQCISRLIVELRQNNSTSPPRSSGTGTGSIRNASPSRRCRARPESGQNSIRRACVPPRLWLTHGISCCWRNASAKSQFFLPASERPAIILAPPKSLALSPERCAPSFIKSLISNSIALTPKLAAAIADPDRSGRRKWFIPPTCADASYRQHATQDPRMVVIDREPAAQARNSPCEICWGRSSCPWIIADPFDFQMPIGFLGKEREFRPRSSQVGSRVRHHHFQAPRAAFRKRPTSLRPAPGNVPPPGAA